MLFNFGQFPKRRLNFNVLVSDRQSGTLAVRTWIKKNAFDRPRIKNTDTLNISKCSTEWMTYTETLRRHLSAVETAARPPGRLGVKRPTPLAGTDRWLDGISVRSRPEACRCSRRTEPEAGDRHPVVSRVRRPASRVRRFSCHPRDPGNRTLQRVPAAIPPIGQTRPPQSHIKIAL